MYPQLEDELFCNIYYLRHLCDTTRFPDWPVKDQVSGIFIPDHFFEIEYVYCLEIYPFVTSSV